MFKPKTAIRPGTKPMKRTPFARNGRIAKAKAGAKCKAKTKSNAGVKPKRVAPRFTSRHRTVSAQDRAYWNRLAHEIGCIACRLAGRATSDHVSIHHIDGRTKPGCHSLVLPLCAGCHQQGTGNDPLLIAVHPNKKRFETRYGLQKDLKAWCDAELARTDARSAA